MKLTGVATVRFERTITVPVTEVEDFLAACDDDDETIAINLDEIDAKSTIESWDSLNLKVLD